MRVGIHQDREQEGGEQACHHHQAESQQAAAAKATQSLLVVPVDGPAVQSGRQSGQVAERLLQIIVHGHQGALDVDVRISVLA